MRKNSLLVLIFIIAFLASACAPSAPATEVEADAPAADTQSEETAPEEEAAPAEEESSGDDESAEEGSIDAAALFASRCAGCHAPDRSGNNGPALLPDRLTRDPSVYITTITDGSGGMPSFGSRLSAAEIEALVDFITTAPQ